MLANHKNAVPQKGFSQNIQTWTNQYKARSLTFPKVNDDTSAECMAKLANMKKCIRYN